MLTFLVIYRKIQVSMFKFAATLLLCSISLAQPPDFLRAQQALMTYVAQFAGSNTLNEDQLNHASEHFLSLVQLPSAQTNHLAADVVQRFLDSPSPVFKIIGTRFLGILGEQTNHWSFTNDYRYLLTTNQYSIIGKLRAPIQSPLDVLATNELILAIRHPSTTPLKRDYKREIKKLENDPQLLDAVVEYYQAQVELPEDFFKALWKRVTPIQRAKYLAGFKNSQWSRTRFDILKNYLLTTYVTQVHVPGEEFIDEEPILVELFFSAKKNYLNELTELKALDGNPAITQHFQSIARKAFSLQSLCDRRLN